MVTVRLEAAMHSARTYAQDRSSGFCAEDGAVVKEDGRQVFHDSAAARYLYLHMTQMLNAVIDASKVRHSQMSWIGQAV